MKEIKELENNQYRYYITQEGKVYTENKLDGTLREKAVKLKQGYPIVRVRLNGKETMHFVHRLVAKAFIPNPENKPQVNHIDENKENPHIDNLEWTTPKENTRHFIVNRSDKKANRVIIICKIRKEVLEVMDFTGDATSKYGSWVSDSIKGASTSGNLIAVSSEEYEKAETIDSLLKTRAPKNYYNNRAKRRKYDSRFVEEVKNKWESSDLAFADFCNNLKIDSRLVRTMLNGNYFKDSKYHQRGRKTAVCHYSGVTRMDFKNYGKKLKIPNGVINYKN